VNNVETVRALYERFSAGDAEGQLALCADDVVYEAPYYGLVRRGREELRAMLGAVAERFDEISYRVVAEYPTTDPDVVIAEVAGDNRVRGTERRYRNHYVMFHTFRDGLVAHWREFSDPTVYQRATGDAP